MSDVLRLVDRFDGLAEYPACHAYVERATARPAFKKAHADQMEHFAAAADEHRVWVQCSHLMVSVSLWVLTLDSYQHYACYMNIKIKSREVIELISI